MISQLPEIFVPDWLAEISQSTITIDPFPLTQLLEDSLYYPSSGFDRDPVKYLSGNILSFIYVDYGRSHDEFENEIIKRGFRGYECVATRSVTEQELTPRGWRPIQPDRDHIDYDPLVYPDNSDFTIEGLKIFGIDREALQKERDTAERMEILSKDKLPRLQEKMEQESERLAFLKREILNEKLREEEKSYLQQDMKWIEARIEDVRLQIEDTRLQIEDARQDYNESECENLEAATRKLYLMGEWWKEKKPYCSWSIFQLREDVPAINGPPRFSLLYLCADGVAAFQALYYANSASPKAVAVIQPGTAFGGNWTDFEDPSGIFADTVLGNPKGSPQILLNGGRGNRDFFREPCWPSYTELICFLDKSRGGSIGVWVEKDKPGSRPERNSNG